MPLAGFINAGLAIAQAFAVDLIILARRRSGVIFGFNAGARDPENRLKARVDERAVLVARGCVDPLNPIAPALKRVINALRLSRDGEVRINREIPAIGPIDKLTIEPDPYALALKRVIDAGDFEMHAG